MNIVDILIVAILAFGVLAGMHKGLIASGLSTVGFVASWLGAQSLYEKIANYALSNQTLMAVLNQYLEPEEFFTTPQQAMTTVSQVVSGGESAISAAVGSLGTHFQFLQEAFSNNIRQEAFQGLGLTTLSDYLNQTLFCAQQQAVIAQIASANEKPGDALPTVLHYAILSSAYRAGCETVLRDNA